MRKTMFALAAGLLGSAAVAQGTGGTVLTNPGFAGGFSNRGQCTAALAKVRNSQRANADTRGAGYQELSGSEFNRASLTTTRCEEIDGRYQVVFYSGGFPEDDSE